jgi:acetoacetyl-CoA synthetase
MAAGKELWRHAAPKTTPMWQFMQRVNERHGLQVNDYPGLYKWSMENTASFWEEVWHFVGITASKPFDEVCSCVSLNLPLPIVTCPFL